MRTNSTLLLSSVFVFSLHAACSSSSGGGGTGGTAGLGGAGGRAATGGAGGQGGSAGSATGGAAAGGQDGGQDAATDAPGGAGGSDTGNDGGADAATLTSEQLRGQYLVKNVLGCAGCHTPSLPAGGADNSKFLGGNDCFTKDMATGGCLASANLTNDDTGLKKYTDQQIKDAFTKGIDPEKNDGGTQYLFAQMPYYQFSNLSDADAQAIVSYLRTVAPVSHEAPANGGPFATQPTAPQWAPVALADLPSASGDAGAGADNGKYLASLMCATCHTVNTAATAPLQLNASKAYQGGKEFTTRITVSANGGAGGAGGAAGGAGGAGGSGATTTISKMIQSANLTPDTTGLATWTVPQIVTAIKMGKDEQGRTICSPMRPFPGLSDQDATDIATYLKGLAPVVNALAETCE